MIVTILNLLTLAVWCFTCVTIANTQYKINKRLDCIRESLVNIIEAYSDLLSKHNTLLSAIEGVFRSTEEELEKEEKGGEQ